MQFRNLKADEVEVKPVSVWEDSCEIAFYVKGISIMNLLDETVGPNGWQKKTEALVRPNDQVLMKTTILIWDPEKGCWISKDGIGEAAKLSPDKSQETDSLKRAALSWGIGRELRSVCGKSRHRIEAPNVAIGEKNGFSGEKIFYVKDKLSVAAIAYGDQEGDGIVSIAIKNQTGKIVLMIDGRSDEQKEADSKALKRKKDLAAKPKLSKKEPSQVKEARKVKADVGGKELRSKKISDLTEDQLIWLFYHTKSATVKDALNVVAGYDPDVKQSFLANGITV